MVVRLIKTQRFLDNRGWFMEVFNHEKFRKMGIFDNFVQDNHSLSEDVGTIRGLHFQAPPHAQAKLVRCVSGAIFDVAVDLRDRSPTYGQWVCAELSSINAHQLYIPIGFAHGFITLERNTEVVYKVSEFYAPDSDGGILWNDPDLAINWPINSAKGPKISSKDDALPNLRDFRSPFEYDGNPLNLLIF